MAGPAPSRRLSYADYLAYEVEASERHAFHDGEIFAMAGGTPAHARLGLDAALAGHPCTATSSDQRMYLGDDGAACADAVVVCPPPRDGASTGAGVRAERRRRSALQEA